MFYKAHAQLLEQVDQALPVWVVDTPHGHFRRLVENQRLNPGGSNAVAIEPPMPYPSWYNFVGSGTRDAAVNQPPNPGGGFPGFLGGQSMNPRPPKARPNPQPLPQQQQNLEAFVEPTRNWDSELNPFIRGGGETTAAYPSVGNSEYGLMFQTNGEPLPLYPAPRPTEILPTRLIFPGPLSSAQTRLQPVPDNAVMSAANQAWYDSLPIGGALVSSVGGPAGATPVAAKPGGEFSSFAGNYPPYLAWEVQNVFWTGVWVNLSAYLEKAASIQVNGSIELGAEGMQFAAIEGNRAVLDREMYSPYPTQVDGGGFFGWLGCRACWPCTQQCWFLGLVCGLEKYGIAIIAIVLLLFELSLMEGILVTDFIGVVPRTATWGDFFYADAPIAPRVATGFVYLIFWILLIGFCFRKLKPISYFRQLGGGRILLRSLADNFEAQSYSYCNMIFWTILFEFDTVIVPAYFPFVLTLLVVETYEGNIREAAILLLIFYLVDNLHSMALQFVHYLACVPAWLIDPKINGFAASGPGINQFVRGARVDRELNTLNYIYLWTTGLGFLVLLILVKIQMTMLYLWVVPIVVAWYCLAWQAIPYCMHGWPVCPRHTGPCVTMTAIATSLVFIAIFCFHHACFLFPCLCAPEVPGYLFFPPNGRIDSPLTGVFDANYNLFLRRFGATEGWDCVWSPPAELTDETAARMLEEGTALSPILAFFTNAMQGWA